MQHYDTFVVKDRMQVLEVYDILALAAHVLL